MTILRPTLLPSLAVFAAAARHQNLAHAAEELHLTASAVSHHVRKLEASLGVMLFQRHARGVTLTGEGRQLADAAAAAVSDLQAVAASLGQAGKARHLRINTLHSLAYCWLIPRLPRFLARHPGLRISIDTDLALTRFEEGGADLAIRHGAGHWPGLLAYPLMDDALFPVAAPALAGIEAIVEPEDLLQRTLLADIASQGWHDWFRAAGVRGVSLPPMHTLSDSTDVMRAAACGVGVALARRHIAEPYLQRGEVVRLPLPSMRSRFSYHAVHPAHRQPGPALTAFIDWLRAEARIDEGIPPAMTTRRAASSTSSATKKTKTRRRGAKPRPD